MHVVLATGGTGGHIEPALNLGDALIRLDESIDVTVLGSDRGMETVIVPARGYRLITVPSVPIPRRPSADLLKAGPRLRRSVNQAVGHLRELRADVVVGFGGYAAAPVYLAARRLHTPLIVHESNARAGLANRLGARFATASFTSYPDALRGAKPMGPPLRRTIADLDRAAMRDEARAFFGLAPDEPVLLVFGGSQGARRLNEAVTSARERLDGVQVLHSYGTRNDPLAPAPGYVPVPFIDRMDLAYAAADLAVTRAGAMTCAELAAVGLPAIYVPLPIGNGEQRLNAAPVVRAGGGILVEDSAFTAEWLTRTVSELLHDGNWLTSMGEAAYQHGVRDSGEQLARITLRIAGGAS